MKNPYSAYALIVLTLALSGCASYSERVNAYAPERQKSDLLADARDYVPDPNAASPFCEEPQQPPPAVSEIYMVMPEEGGKVGTVAVTLNDGRESVLHGAYSAMSLAGGEGTAFVSNQAQMNEIFGSAVTALPKAPLYSMLYFLLGKDELTPASKLEAENIYRDIVDRQSTEIMVVGHTDTVGSKTHNKKLSLKRAEKVRRSLIGLGVPADSIQTSGRGEDALLVETPDNTKEPKNRRVEINVR